MSEPTVLFRVAFGKRSFEVHASEELTKLIRLATDELRQAQVRRKEALDLLSIKAEAAIRALPYPPEQPRPRVTAAHMAQLLEKYDGRYLALSVFIEDLAPLGTCSKPAQDTFVFPECSKWYELRRYPIHGVAVVARQGVLLKSWEVVPAGDVSHEPTGYPATSKLQAVLIGKTLSGGRGSSRSVLCLERNRYDDWLPVQGSLLSWLMARLANDYVIAAVPTGHE